MAMAIKEGHKRTVEGNKNSTGCDHVSIDKLREHSNTFDDFRKKQEVIAIISKVKVRSKRDRSHVKYPISYVI